MFYHHYYYYCYYYYYYFCYWVVLFNVSWFNDTTWCLLYWTYKNISQLAQITSVSSFCIYSNNTVLLIHELRSWLMFQRSWRKYNLIALFLYVFLKGNNILPQRNPTNMKLRIKLKNSLQFHNYPFGFPLCAKYCVL